MATSSAALPSTRRRPVPRWVAITAAVLIVLFAVFWFWGRNSSLVAVDDITITGTHGSDAPAVERALRDAAGSMTTLNFDPAVVRRAVASYPVVASVEVRTAFPHKATIVVHQRTPVATISTGGKDVPVAKDGTLLIGTSAGKGLPALASDKPPVAGQITDRDTLAEVRVLAGATAAQRREVTRIGVGARGVEVQLNGKPTAYFGDADAPRDQWVALERVLADPASQGASYVDVTVARRPAAGGFTDPAVDDGSADDGAYAGDATGDPSADGTGDGSGDDGSGY
jgi:cell division protein FtsQ